MKEYLFYAKIYILLIISVAIFPKISVEIPSTNFQFYSYNNKPETYGPRGVMTNVFDCDVREIEFESESFYYVHFQTNTLKKGMNFLS